MDDLNPRVTQPPRGGVVANAELKPHVLRPLGDDVVDVLIDVGRSAEHVDHVDIARDVRQLAIDFFAEDLGG